jgi:hypothetical protein
MFRRGAEASSWGVDVAAAAVLRHELADSRAARVDEQPALAKLRARRCMR